MPIRRTRKNRTKPNIIDLFSGAGGLSLGAERAGFSVSCAVELDSNAIATHLKNFPQTLHLQRDITSLTGADVCLDAKLLSGEIDGIIGGPPCQGFSTIGRQSPDDARSQLFISFFRLVRELKPRFFLAENVPGILNEQHNYIRQAAFSLVQKDYDLLAPLVIRANEYGAATTRTRIFFLGLHRKAFPSALSPEDFNQLKVLPDNMIRVKKALTGLSVNLPDTGIDQLSCDIPTTGSEDFFGNRIQSCVPPEVGDTETLAAYFENRIVTGCTPTRHSPAVAKRYGELRFGEQDPISKSHKLNPDGFCPTLRAGTGPEKGSFQAVRPIHFNAPRVITPREAARLQGFPDWFALPPTKWHSFRQIGNSVSPIVAEKILSIVYQRIT